MALGVHLAKRALLNLLQSNIGAACADQEAEESLGTGEIPVPAQWQIGPEQDPADMSWLDASLGLYPIVFIDGTQAASGPRDMQRVTGGRTWKMPYELRVVWHCRRTDGAKDPSVTVLDRDRLDAVFRRIVVLSAIPGSVQAIDMASPRPEYGDVFEDRKFRPVTAGGLRLTVLQQETVVRPPLTDPDVTTVDVTVEELP